MDLLPSFCPADTWRYVIDGDGVLTPAAAYTHYAFFEWSLVFWDVAFDAVTMAELKHIRVSPYDTCLSLGTDLCPDRNHRHLPTEREARRQQVGASSGDYPRAPLSSNPSTPHEIFLRPCAPLIQQTEVDWTAATDRPVVSGERRALCAWLSDVYLGECKLTGSALTCFSGMFLDRRHLARLSAVLLVCLETRCVWKRRLWLKRSSGRTRACTPDQLIWLRIILQVDQELHHFTQWSIRA